MIIVMIHKNIKRNKPNYGNVSFAKRLLYNSSKINLLNDFAQLFFNLKIKTRKLKICNSKYLYS